MSEADSLTLERVRPCLEGVIPCVIATCDAAGIPNASYVSQIHYVDRDHVALSFQFFNKTHRNMTDNPQLTAYMIDPETVARYRMALLYLRTESDGPLFESMKARLASIASHTGMSDVFVLRGADICRVLHIEKVPGCEAARPVTSCDWPHRLRTLSDSMSGSYDLAGVFDAVLNGLSHLAGIAHGMILIADEGTRKLFTVASTGYEKSGVGSEVPYGCGVIGVAAQFRTPVRINHMAAEYQYNAAIRNNLVDRDDLEDRIPFPGLSDPQSQIALPLLADSCLLGVLFLECTREMAFDFQDEDALVVLATLLAQTITLQQRGDAGSAPDIAASPAPVGDQPPITVRFYPANDSVFVDDIYLIKGLAGRILWRLLTVARREQRLDFSNRELRLDSTLKMPDIDDNLEARLILLRRRLQEKCPALAIQKTGRGQFRLHMKRPVILVDHNDA